MFKKGVKIKLKIHNLEKREGKITAKKYHN